MADNKKIATNKFIAGPAIKTEDLFSKLFDARLAGSEGSSSPNNRTKPPKGMMLRLYTVSPRITLKSLGGNPIPNSKTRTPKYRAVK